MFKLINLIVFVQRYFHFELDVCNMFQKSWDRGMFTTVLHHFPFE